MLILNKNLFIACTLTLLVAIALFYLYDKKFSYVPLMSVKFSSNYDRQIYEEIDPKYKICFLITYAKLHTDFKIDENGDYFIRKSLSDDVDLMLKNTQEAYKLANKSKLKEIPYKGSYYCADFSTEEFIIN